MLDALILTMNDWSNTGWRMFKCLQFLGLDVMGFKGEFHPFWYPEQLPIYPALAAVSNYRDAIFTVPRDINLLRLVENSKVIHFTASTFVDCGRDLKDKKVVFQHGGRTYRIGHTSLNPTYNAIADASIVQMPDLMGLGAKNEHLIYFPVDTNFLKPDFSKADPSDKLVIGHFPSADTKGTPGIENVIKRLAKDPETSGRFLYMRPTDPIQPLPWIVHLQRLRKCDLLIDVFAKTAQGDYQYGEWGNASFEAAALGKVAVTMSLKYDTYLQEYGESALKIANDQDQLFSALREVILMPPKQLREEKEKTRAWVSEKHSIEATAQRLWDRIYSKFNL